MKRMQLWFTVLLIVLLTLVCSQALADPVTINVSTTAEWTDAKNTINSSAAQEYIINLTANLDNAPEFIVNKDGAVVTILGNGHTITLVGQDTSIGATAGTVNLGKADGTDTLTITSNDRNDSPGAISITNGTVNMYDGVTIRDVMNNNYFGGGVTIRDGTFNMYGGTIEHCGVQDGSVCFGGGVALSAGGTFNMYDGTIKDCYATTRLLPENNKGVIPYGAGGGVFVGGGSTFKMTGGSIENCSTSESGGGVFIVASKDSYFNHSSFGYLDSRFEMTGGSITGCTAPFYGGGIAVDGCYVNADPITINPYAAGTPSNPGVFINGGTITGNKANKSGGGVFGFMLETPTKILNGSVCNNIGEDDSSDVFIQAASDVEIAIGTGSYNGPPSDITGKPIDGWYEDYGDRGNTRFVDQAPADRVLVADGSMNIPGVLCLIAAANPTDVTVTLDLQGHGSLPEDVYTKVTDYQYKQVISPGTAVAQPDAPTAAGWQFGGWYTDAACTTAYDFTTLVTEDITLYAKWTELYTVKFDLQGYGAPKPADQIVPKGGVATEPTAPSADGFRFGGWYTEAACTNLYNFSTPVTADMTLFAKWTAQVSVEKVWILSINGGNYQPASIKVQLYNGVTPVGTPVEISEDADGHWRYTWPDELPVDGTYTVKEIMEGDMDKHYTAIVEEVTKNSFKIANVANEELKVTITNTHNPYEVDVTLNKTWNDDDNTQRPDVIHVVVSFVDPNGVTKYIAADGTEHDTEVTIDLTAPTWTATIEDLFKNQNHGQMIVYTVEEKSINGYKGVITYTQDADGNWTFSIVNTLTGKTDILGTKVWDDDNDRDGIRPGSITLNVYRNTVDPANLAAGPITVTYPAGDQYANNWAWTVEDLPTYDKNGDPITYVVVEDPVPGYNAPVVVYVPVTPLTPVTP